MEQLPALKTEYNEFMIPPNLGLARLHEACNRYGAPAERDAAPEVCQCCGAVESKPYSFHASTDELVADGPVIPLMFRLYKTLILLSAIMTVISFFGEYYIVHANCSDGVKESFCGFNLTTLLDYRRRSGLGAYSSKFLSFVALPCVGIFLAFIIVHKIRSFKFAESVLKGNLKISDFSIMITGLSSSQQNEESIKKLLDSRLKSKYPSSVPVQIDSFSFGRAEGRFALQRDHLAFLRSKLEALEKLKQETQDFGLAAELDKRVKAQLKQIEKCKAPKINEKSNAVTFVTLKHRRDVARILNSATWFDTVRRYLSYLPCPIKELKFQPAPEPSDFLWDNIGYSNLSLKCRRLVSYFAVLVLLGICTLFLYLFILLKLRLSTSKKSESGSESGSNKMLSTVVQVVLSCSISLVNKSVYIFSFKLSDFRKPLSRGIHQKYAISLISLFQFLNSISLVILSPLLDVENKDYFLAEQMFFQQLSNMILTPLLNYFSVGLILQKFFQRRVEDKLAAGQLHDLTQLELNQMYTPPELNMCDTPMDLIRTAAVAFFVFEQVPSGMLLCTVGIVLQYLVVKLLLVSRYKKMPKYNQELAFEYNHCFDGLLIKFILGILVTATYTPGKSIILSSRWYWVIIFAVTIWIALRPHAVPNHIRNVLRSLCFFKRKPKATPNQKDPNLQEQLLDNPTAEEPGDSLDQLPPAIALDNYELWNPLSREAALKKLQKSKDLAD